MWQMFIGAASVMLVKCKLCRSRCCGPLEYGNLSLFTEVVLFTTEGDIFINSDAGPPPEGLKYPPQSAYINVSFSDLQNNINAFLWQSGFTRCDQHVPHATWRQLNKVNRVFVTSPPAEPINYAAWFINGESLFS